MDCPVHILLVEDSRTQALQWTHVLETAGWQVKHVASAEQAMEQLGRQTPDLILIDYYLPGIRGDELCRQMRMRIDTRLTPIVILTGEAKRQTELRGLESGADDFIAKSDDPEALLLRLRALLAKSLETPRPVPRAEASFEGARLLAVDDSQTYLAYLVAELQAESYRVETANGGAAAIERLASEEFDCLLVDLVMPDVDGIEVCRRTNNLRAEHRCSTMVLMLTAMEDNQSLARALEAGADDFVGKSSDIIVIKGRIRALLRRKYFEDEHRHRLSAELRAKELEAHHAQIERRAAEARAALVDDLQRTATALRRSNEELQQFAYVASHDLQEPLRAVASYARLLERRYADSLDADAREYIQYVVGGAVRMKSLIRDLLTYSRVETRGDFQTINMQTSLDDAEANLRFAIEESQASVTSDELPLVRGDRAQLAQLLQNLVGNAIKYRGSRTPCIHIGARHEEGSWVFSVADNGIGISPAYFERIFVIFQRLHPAADYPGTGIGLAIAKRIVERHGGRIWVESAGSEGSTFYFTLPDVAALPVPAAQAPGTSAMPVVTIPPPKAARPEHATASP